MSKPAWLILTVMVAGVAAAAWVLLAKGPNPTAISPEESGETAATSAAVDGSRPERGGESSASPGGSAQPGKSVARPSSGKSVVTGRIVDAVTGAGIGRARVVLRHPLGEFAAVGDSEADGSFTLGRVPMVFGALLFVTKDGYGPKLVRDVHVTSRDRKDLGAIDLHRGLPIGGRVVAALGAPIAGAQVDLIESSYARPGYSQDLIEIFRELRRDDDSLDQVVTAADGTFAFPAAAPGSYVLAARKPGWQVRFSTPLIVAAGAATSHVELRLIEAKSLSGVVKDESGNPIAGAEVAALELAPSTTIFPKSQKTRTGADGRFGYSTFGDGEVALIVQAAGYSGASVGNIEAGGKEVEIVLRKAAIIQGRVFDLGTGNGLPGASVVAFRLDREAALEETRSGADGMYVIEAGPSGSNVIVFAKLDGYVMANLAEAMMSNAAGEALFGSKAENDCAPGATVRRDLGMVGGGSLSGRVVDEATGQGISNAEIVARHETHVDLVAFSDPVQARSGADGSFTIPSIGAGKVSLTAEADGYVALLAVTEDDEEQGRTAPARPANVEIRPGSSVTNLVVRLRRGIEIEVLVTDPDRNPVPGATVTWMVPDEQTVELFGPRKRPRTVATDNSGKARLKALPGQNGIIVAARHPDFHPGGHVLVNTVPPPTRPAILTLVRGAAIAGVVLDADGRPAANREVSYLPKQDVVMLAFGEWRWLGHRALTDAAGKFLLENLPPGAGSIDVTSKMPPQNRDGDAGRSETEALDASQSQVDLVAGKREEVTLRLVRTASISGVVYDAAGKPAKSLIHATPAGAPEGAGESWVETGDDGTFVIAGLRPGSYRLEVIIQTEAGPQKLIRVASTGSSNLELRFAKSG